MRFEEVGGVVVEHQGLSEVARDELRRIERKDGQLSWKSVLKEAQKLEAKHGDKSPLHAYFTWDVHEAAKKQWASEARTLIRAYVIVLPNEDIEMKAFLSLEDGNTRRYESAFDTARNAEYSAAYEQKLLRELEQLKERIKKWRRFKEVVAAIDKALAS